MTRSRPPLKIVPPQLDVPASSGAELEVGDAPTSATQRIVDSITNAIAERRLMPGTKLSEQKIGDIFEVSRTVVRQAFNQLSRDRLVVLEPARGAFVATPTAEEARDVFEVRAILETAVTKQLCATITDEQIRQLRVHLEQERAAVNNAEVPGRTRLLADFHIVLARMLGNQVLEQMLSELLTRSSLIALMRQSSQSAEESHGEHVAIVDAFERRDVRAAVRLVDKHLGNVQRNLDLDPQRIDLANILNH
ncbi:GntR family transcriptional regulator [Massilia sp. 2TAF26]|uniref:GntR family transcriptional regulator n=1 Tax=Massilia sp. 2TAF26 TaxID=3233012 RepID=UPI003F965F3F